MLLFWTIRFSDLRDLNFPEADPRDVVCWGGEIIALFDFCLWFEWEVLGFFKWEGVWSA